MPLALVAVAILTEAVSQPRFIKGDGLTKGQPQGMEVGFLGEGELASKVVVYLHRLGEQLRPPALRLDPFLARLVGAAMQAERSSDRS